MLCSDECHSIPPLFAMLSVCGLDALLWAFSTDLRLFVTSARSVCPLEITSPLSFQLAPLLLGGGDDSSAFTVDLPKVNSEHFYQDEWVRNYW
jgi:hypothetical protein